MHEAVLMCSGSKLRDLFVSILVNCSPHDPLHLYTEHRDSMSIDFLHRARVASQDFSLSLDDQIYNVLLNDLSIRLSYYNKLLNQFNLPEPSQVPGDAAILNRAIYLESQYDVDDLRQNLQLKVEKMNTEQNIAYSAICDALQSNSLEPKMFFLDAPGGTGKTYVENSLLSFVRSNNRIAIAVASSGIAALLLQNGTTVHYRFQVPLNVFEDTTCKVTVQSEAAELIRQSDLIIWDEAVMQHRYVYEAVDRLIRDITQIDIPMGGKVCVLGGDFKQILPVVRNGRRADIVGSCIKKSRLWKHVKTLHLTINMRSFLREGSESTEFSRFLDRVGSGTEQLYPNIGKNFIKIKGGIG